MSNQHGRVWFAVTAALVFAGVLVQVIVSGTNDEGLFPTPAGRIFNVFCYFTVLSNLIVGVTSLLLALRPGRTSRMFAVLRLAGLVMITVTFIVFHVALSHLVDLEGWAKIADQILHTLVPIAAVVGWIRFGPRGLATARVATLTLVAPLAWIAFALIRGELIDFYPYPFVDVSKYGYGRVALNSALIAVLFYSLARAAVGLDRRLARRHAEPDRTAKPRSTV